MQQKRRTRAALLVAAVKLMEEGQTPTVAEVAKMAMVSRATAYLYFPTQESLLTEAPFQLGTPTPEELFGDDDSKLPDVEDRVDLLERAVHRVCYDGEPQIRMFLRISMDRWFAKKKGSSSTPLRQGRRLRLIETALRPIRDELDKNQYETLCASLAMIIGIESLIALSDVARLNRQKAGRVKRWVVRTLVRAALAEAHTGKIKK